MKPLLGLVMQPGVWLRATSLAAGVVSNLLFLNLAYTSVDAKGFGFLVVLTNLAMVIQTLDLGVAGAVVNESGRFAEGRSKLAMAPFVYASTCVAVLIGSGALASLGWHGELLASNGAFSGFLAIIVVLGAGVAAAVLKIPLGVLIGQAKMAHYYGYQLAQPLVMLVGVALADKAGVGLIALSFLFAASVLSPGMIAFTRALTNQSLSWRFGEGSVRQETARTMRRASTLGVSQIASIAGYSLLPTVVGFAAGPTSAALYAVPHRVFLSAWSVVGVLYTAQWGEMSQSVHGSKGSEDEIVRRVNRTGAVVATGLGALFILAVPLLVRVVGNGDLHVPMLVSLPIGIALIIRGTYLGYSLHAAVRYPSVALVAGELGLASVAMATVILAERTQVWAGAAAVLAYSIVDGIILWRSYVASAQRRVEVV